MLPTSCTAWLFQPTPRSRERGGVAVGIGALHWYQFQTTPAHVSGEAGPLRQRGVVQLAVSTHSAHVSGDATQRRTANGADNVSTHSPPS